MTEIIQGDILKSPRNEVICHQVNTSGAFGSGLAKSIRKKYPEVYNLYIEQCNHKDCELGDVFYVHTSDDRLICNMFAQSKYGNDGKRYTNYEAFYRCLERITTLIPTNVIVAMPYKIGCGLGGGNWDIIKIMIDEVLMNYHVKLYQI